MLHFVFKKQKKHHRKGSVSFGGLEGIRLIMVATSVRTGGSKFPPDTCDPIVRIPSAQIPYQKQKPPYEWLLFLVDLKGFV